MFLAVKEVILQTQSSFFPPYTSRRSHLECSGSRKLVSGVLLTNVTSPQVSTTYSLWKCGSGRIILVFNPVQALDTVVWASSSFLDTAPQGPMACHTPHILRSASLVYLCTSIGLPSSRHDTFVYPALLQSLPLLSPRSWLL